MNRILILLSPIIFATIAGCQDEALSKEPRSVPEPNTPTKVVLTDLHWNFTNRAPQPFANPVVVTAFQIDEGMTNLTVHIKQVARPPHAFADNAILRSPGGTSDPQAFNGPEYAIEWSHQMPSPGRWTVEYSADEIAPGGIHHLHVLVTSFTLSAGPLDAERTSVS